MPHSQYFIICVQVNTMRLSDALPKLKYRIHDTSIAPLHLIISSNKKEEKKESGTATHTLWANFYF